jgi:cyanophycinase
MQRLFRSALLAVAALACSQSPAPDGSVAPSNSTAVAPERGALVVVGGGRVGPDIVNEFIRLAGGKQSPIVVIPTAGGDTAYTESGTCTRFLRAAGATDVTVLHTYDPKLADTEEFVAPIRRASAVWFPGGRQWRLADAYLGTRTERELHALLARGGVVGGSSAGASIQASYLVRGAPEGNTIMMAPGHEKGFGFLRDVAIDQHVLARNRLNDLPEVLAKHKQLLGIGIDEGTAIVVQRDTFAVLGASKVFVYGGRDTPDSGKVYRTLVSGDRYDLRQRRIIPTN